METCRACSLPVDLRPPLAATPPNVFGHLLDPQLAEVLHRANGGFVGFVGMDGVGGDTDISTFNEDMRAGTDDPPRSFVVYAQISGEANYLATLPDLAESDGVQPVGLLNLHEGSKLFPLASSVDAAFGTLARRLGQVAGRFATPDQAAGALKVPWGAAEPAARDRRLVERITAGDFDAFRRDQPDVAEWIEMTLAATRA
ncbi:MAG: hypothetical protein M3540_06155 [Actinomycetota bacterium]|nr:hypothetical protein [Actinomycetota bacterium]